MKVGYRNTKNIFTIFRKDNNGNVVNLIVINRNKKVIMRDGLEINSQEVSDKVNKILKEHSGVDCDLDSLKFCFMNRIKVNRIYLVIKPRAYTELLHEVHFKTTKYEDYMYVYGVPYLILDTLNMELIVKRGFFSDANEMILRAATNLPKCPFDYDEIYSGLDDGYVYDYKIIRR